MRVLGIAGLAMMMAGAAQAQTPPQASEVLIGLGESCWEADLGEGVTDTHCFSIARNGHLVMDVHKVRSRSTAVVYEGATLYRREEATGAMRWDYYNSNGGLISGYVKRDGQRLVFSDTPGGLATTVWYLAPEAYEVGTAAVTAAKQRFEKIGPAPEGGF